MNRDKHIYDVLAVGFGPSNIALAAAIEELNIPLDILFLEAKNECTWQPGMLFADADIQNHPLRDLVTPRNPRSRYSFVNFLFENGRLFEHLNLGLHLPMRIEYAQYVKWVASHFAHWVKYGERVATLRIASITENGMPLYEVATDDSGSTYLSRALVIAPGRTPYIPEPFCRLESNRIAHLNDYLTRIEEQSDRLKSGRVAVVGSSQSAVEIMLHLSECFPNAQITGISRRFGYRMKDSSPFTGEVYFPGFVDLFYGAEKHIKQRLREDLHFTNYSAADADVLERLYQRIYHRRLLGQHTLSVLRSTEIVDARVSENDVELDIASIEDGGALKTVKFDLVIVATGFRDIGTSTNQERYPLLLEALAPFLELDAEGCIQISRDYSLATTAALRGAPMHLNGLCESSHGMGDAGSFSLLSLRAQSIVESLQRRLLSRRREATDIAGFANCPALASSPARELLRSV